MTALTDEEKRAKIAEACGWRKTYKSKIKGSLYGKNPNGKHWLTYSVPNYLNSLDAIAEAVASLSSIQKMLFHNYLTEICEEPGRYPGGGVDHSKCEHPIHATAKQRAEAFGKTLGLW